MEMDDLSNLKEFVFKAESEGYEPIMAYSEASGGET